MSTPPATGIVCRDRLPEVFVHCARVEVEDLGDHPDLAARVGDGLADVACLHEREFLAVILDEGGEAAQQARAVGRRHRAPGGKRRFRRGHCAIGLSDPRSLELCHGLFRGRVQQAQRHPRS
jgi:hypothetical protein